MVPFVFIVLGFLSRVIIHIPNFTPIIAIALFSGIYFKKTYSVLLPVLILIVSDLFLGVHATMPFTWGSVLLIAWIGDRMRGKNNFQNTFWVSVASSLLFFFITNLGVWLVSGLYPLGWNGLSECFILALPFFRNELLATLIYTFIFFSAYEAIKNRLAGTRFAHVL